MAESPFSWRRAERMYRPYCGEGQGHRVTQGWGNCCQPPSCPHPFPVTLPALWALTVQLPAHRFWMAPAEASRIAGVLLSFRREMYIRTTSGWKSSS